MKFWPFALLAFVLLVGNKSVAGEAAPTAVFPLSLDDTSLQGEVQGPRADEQKRLDAANTQLRDMLTRSGCCSTVDLGSVSEQAKGMDMRTCDGCDVDLARKVGAKLSVTGWVQKVSNLILNLNLVVRDVSTGKIVEAGSVDIRGNTDKSWSRGLSYLLRERLHPAKW